MNGGGDHWYVFSRLLATEYTRASSPSPTDEDQGPLYAVRRVPSAENLCAFDIGILDGKGIVDLYLGPEQIALLET